jgi:hypothetical protein
MAAWTRALSFISPLTYVQDLMNHAVLGTGYLNPGLDLLVPPSLLFVFVFFAARLHQRSRKLGY